MWAAIAAEVLSLVLAVRTIRIARKVKRTCGRAAPQGWCFRSGCYCFLDGEILVSVPTNSLALAGTGCLPVSTASVLVPLPYRCSFASSSSRRVEPCNEIPPKTPLERDQDRISAVI